MLNEEYIQLLSPVLIVFETRVDFNYHRPHCAQNIGRYEHGLNVLLNVSEMKFKTGTNENIDE